MIVAAGLLVLVGLGLFVAGILTGITLLYWACVAACVVAAVLIVVVWRQMPRKKAAGAEGGPTTAPSVTSGSAAPSVTATARRGEATTKPAPAPAVPPAGSAADTSVDTSVDATVGAPPVDAPDPEVEDVEVTDLLVVVDLKDEVLVVDEHPRYHVTDCAWLKGRETIPLPVDEARTDGFTPCAVCSPDRTLAARARRRKQ